MPGEFVAGSIVGKMDLDNSPTIKAMEQVKAESASMKQKIEIDGKEAGDSLSKSMKETMEKVEGEMGRRSGWGKLLRIGMEGGVVGMAGMALKGMTDKMSELTAQFREGKIGGGEMVEKLAEGIPIIGDFVTAGRDIREMFTGEKAQIEQINEEIRTGNELMEARVALSSALRAASLDMHLSEMKSLTEIANIGMDVKTQEVNNLGLLKATLQETRDKRLDAYMKPVLDARTKELDGLKQSLADAEKAWANAGVATVDSNLKSQTMDPKEFLKEYADLDPEAKKTAYGLHTAENLALAKDAINAARAYHDKNQELGRLGDKEGGPLAAAFNKADALAGTAIDSKIGQRLMEQWFDRLKRLAEPAMEFGEKWGAAWKKFDSDAEQAIKRSADAMRALQKESRQFGMSDAQKKLDDFSSMPGSDASMTARVRDAIRKENDARIMQETATPLEKFKTEMDQIAQDLRAGLIDKIAALRLENSDFQKLRAAMPQQEYQPTQQEVRRFGFGGTAPPMVRMAEPLQELSDLFKDSVGIQAEQRDLLKDIHEDAKTVEQWTPSAL